MKNILIATFFFSYPIADLNSQINDSSAIVNAAIEAFYLLPSSTLITRTEDSLALVSKLKYWEIVTINLEQPDYKLSFIYNNLGYITKVVHRSFSNKDSTSLLIDRSSNYEVEFEYEFSAKALADSDRFSFRTVVDELKLNEQRYRFRCRFQLSSDNKANISINLNSRFLGIAKGIPLPAFSALIGFSSNFIPDQEDVDSTIVNDTLIHTRIYRSSPDRPKLLAKNYILLPSRRNLRYAAFEQNESMTWQEFSRTIFSYDSLDRITSRFDYEAVKSLPNIDSFIYYHDGKLRSHLQIRPNYYEDRVETIFSPAGITIFKHWEGYYRSLNAPFGVRWPYRFTDTYFEYSDRNLLSRSIQYLDGKISYVEQHHREFW